MGNSAGGTSNIGSNLVSSLGSFGQMAQGISMTEAGTKVAVQGAEMDAQLALQGGQYAAAVYDSYKSSAISQTNYDTALVTQQLGRQSDALSRQITAIAGRNTAIEGASGLAPGSKSYLAVSSTYLSNTERQIVQMRNSAQTQQNEIQYQGNLAVTQLQNQSNNALYQGQVQAAEASYQAAVAQYEGNVQRANEENKGISSAIGAIFGG